MFILLYVYLYIVQFTFDPLLTKLGIYAAEEYAFCHLGAVNCCSANLFGVNCLLFPFYQAHSSVSVDPVTNISRGSIFKSINQKCMLEEFYVIGQRLPIV
jgi:hypothetical protein